MFFRDLFVCLHFFVSKINIHVVVVVLINAVLVLGFICSFTQVNSPNNSIYVSS